MLEVQNVAKEVWQQSTHNRAGKGRPVLHSGRCNGPSRPALAHSPEFGLALLRCQMLQAVIHAIGSRGLCVTAEPGLAQHLKLLPQVQPFGRACDAQHTLIVPPGCSSSANLSQV